METIRSMYELPYLMHYLSTHKEELGLPALDIKCLEEGFVDSESLLPAFLTVKLLQKLMKNQDISLESYESELKKILEAKSSSLNPYKLQTDVKFQLIPHSSKLKIIKWLADQSTEKKDELDTLFEEFGSDKMETIINAGQDSENRTYWYFDDLRLYRHKTSQPKTDDWETVAVNLNDWQSLIDKLSKTNNEQERDLFTYLKDYIYPLILQGLSQNHTPVNVTNDQLRSRAGMSVKQKKDLEEAIKLENPELSKVLSEEPSNAAGGDKKPPNPFPRQNKVFVFSTQMANRAADSVRIGQSKCFLSAHLDDPDTKQFLKQHPNIDTSLPTAVNKIHVPNNCHQPANTQRSMSMPVKQEFPASPYYNPSPHMMPPAQPGSHPCAHAPGPHPPGIHGAPMMPGQRPDISRNIVPSENLTPEQRQHRENSLASLARIQKMFDVGEIDIRHTDFSQLTSAIDRPGNFPSGGPGGHEYSPMLGGPHPMHNPNNTGIMPDQKPPPPYQMVMGSPGSQTSKPGRKRKNSSVQSPAPKSPLSQQMKSPKVAPSPLANPNHRPASISHMTPQSVLPGGPPALPQKFVPPQYASHPAPFQPNDNIESITAPPSHMLQYSQAEEERTITLQRNTSISQNSEVTNPDGSTVIDRMSCNVLDMKQNRNYTKESLPQHIPPKTGSSAFNNVMTEKAKVVSSRPGESAQTPNTSVPCSSGTQPLSVNNTYVNAHMSIGQVNIQNVTASQYGNGGPGHMQQNIDINMANFNQMGPGSQPRMPHPSPQGGHPSNPAYGAPPNVRIQNKGPNTIQYLPVSQGQTTPALPPSHEPIIPIKHPEYMNPRIPAPFYPAEGGGGQSYGFPHSSHPPGAFPPGFPHGTPYEPRHAGPPQYMVPSGPSPGPPSYAYRGPVPPHHPDMYDPMTMHPNIPRSSAHMMIPPDHHHPSSPYPSSFPPSGPPADYISHPVRGGAPTPHHLTPGFPGPGGQPW